MEGIIEFLTWAGIFIVVSAAIGFTFGRLYQRAERDEAFVRTGVGGRRVVKDGGAIILPVLHALAKVKLNTVKLIVDRRREDAFITADRMRVDIRAEFYVRVDGTDDGIALAAQTLGDRVNDPKAIQDLVEAKLVDALRSVAARNTLDQLHESRADFVKAVQEAVETDLRSNGLELESVSLTGLDQTLELSRQSKAIAVAMKSEETLKAEAKAREAEALTVAASEKVQTAREREMAERRRQIAILEAQEKAESEAITITVGATADRNAAEDRAEAILVEARAEAEAAKVRADATRVEGEAQAAAIQAKNEASNTLSDRMIEFELTQARVRMLPEALKALMEPTSRIESIRVFDTSGFSAGNQGTGERSGPSDLADQLLRFSGNKPLVDALLAAAGIQGTGGSLKDVLADALERDLQSK